MADGKREAAIYVHGDGSAVYIDEKGEVCLVKREHESILEFEFRVAIHCSSERGCEYRLKVKETGKSYPVEDIDPGRHGLVWYRDNGEVRSITKDDCIIYQSRGAT